MPDINGIPYVESDDLVSAYPSVSQSLAQEVSDQLAAKLDLAGGKILQIVRATDSTSRSTTSTSYVDVTGMSVTITPQKSDSAVLLVCTVQLSPAGGWLTFLQITDSSNNGISGAQDNRYGINTGSEQRAVTLMAYSTPATTSATTYKLRFKTQSGTTAINNDFSTGQMFAIEVSA